MNDKQELEGPLRLRVVSDGLIVTGRECPRGHYTTAYEDYACPDCGARLVDAEFGPAGVVWSFTTITTPAPGRVPPFSLAYVDLERGPRILCDVSDDAVGHLAVGDRVRIAALEGRPTIAKEGER